MTIALLALALLLHWLTAVAMCARLALQADVAIDWTWEEHD